MRGRPARGLTADWTNDISRQGLDLVGEHLVERVAQHRHCQNCDKAIPYKDKFCDEKCEGEFKSKMLAKKRQLIYFYGLMVIVFIGAMILVFMG
ncbi:MAG: DUF2116 family Zn-ribbon domain-containing protein [Candidatus Thermoplasmatota archaeon]|nr:DUF2116 family Zn-ribbon domain-containing protein [Candidatus Thermoplasmatota archaeon]